MSDATAAAEVFLEGAQLNRDDPLRDGNVLIFPDHGQVVMTGDLHGHRRNFDKLKRYCDLEHLGARHVILHEIIHEEVESLAGRDKSHEALLEVARWKCECPDQVHVLQSNHEIAQATGREITKNGRGLTLDFERAVRAAYGVGADRVSEAINKWICSLPLAGRTPNRIFLSHSLPGPRDLPAFDPEVLTLLATGEYLAKHASAQALVWGRYHTKAALDTLGKLLDADFFLCGHQPQETGYDVLFGRMIILASDHNHGVFLPVDLSKPVTLESLIGNIRPIASIS